MKVLFITTEGFDTPGPNNQMAMVMIQDFLDAGIDVHLVQSRRRKVYDDIPPMLQNKKGFTYDIVDRKIINKSRFLHRYLDEAWFAISSWKKWRRVEDANVVFLQSCPTVLYQLIMLRLFNKKPIVYNIYDVFPGHAYDIGVIKSKTLYNALRCIQKFTYRLSTVVSVLSEDMKKKISAQNVPLDKIRVVPAWYDDKAVHEVPREENRFIKKYSIPADKFYVQFAGTIGYVLDCKAIIEAAALLQNEPKIVFQIVGDGTTKDEFMEKVKERGLSNVSFYPIQPIELVPDVYSACSICLIPLKKGVIGNGVPSKAPLLMACRRVIVNSVEPDSDYFRMFNENNIGVAVSNQDYRALADAILDLYHKPDKIEEMANNAKRFSCENYSSTQNTKKFIEIFRELTR